MTTPLTLSMARSRALPFAGHGPLLKVTVPLCFLVIFMALFEFTPLDPMVSSWFFDADTNSWPFRDNFFVEDVLHKGAKYLAILVGLWALTVFLLSFKKISLRPLRRKVLYLFLAMALSSGIIGALKYASKTHCPWDLDLYGGKEHYIHLLKPFPEGACPGKCFPGGHASCGFCFFALYFIFKESSRRRGVVGLWIGFLAGNTVGLAQVARGAHFLSHHLWTGVLVWFVCLGLYHYGFSGNLSENTLGQPSPTGLSERGEAHTR